MVRQLFLYLLVLFIFAACSSSDDYNTNTPEGAFKAAESYEKDELWDEAIQKYSDVKNKFPYSKLAVEAELKIADLQYQREAYVEAQNAYQLFRELHPKHSKIAYVIHRIGLSFFNQLPSTIDRDLSLAKRAIVHFEEIIEKFPQSEFLEEAKSKRAEARKMLAEKNLYIAEFYFIRDMFDSALFRYENLHRDHGVDGFSPKALLGAGRSAAELGERAKAEKYFSQLIKEHSGSEEAALAQKDMQKYGIY